MTANNSQLDMNHWLIRLVAAIIDAIIPFIAGLLLFALINRASAAIQDFSLAPVFLYPVLQGLMWILYSMIFEVSWNGQSLGKKLLKLQVQMVNGSKIDYAKSFTRNLSKIYWVILILDWLLGVITQSSDHRQRYFDRIAGTTVVSLKQSLNVPPPPPPQ